MESPAVIPTIHAPVDASRLTQSGFFFRMLSDGRREALFWILQLVFWGAIGIIGFFMTLAFRSSMPDVGWAVIVRVTSGFVLTSGLRFVYRNPGIRAQRGWIKWMQVAACCLGAGLLELVALRLCGVAGIYVPGGAEIVGGKLFAVRLFTVVIWSILYFAFHMFEDEHVLVLRATRAELAARENELRHLQAQMNPHFVFNALKAVLACKDDPVAVAEVTQSLSEYLRFLLKETRPLEPLSREFGALEKFLTVQASHFKDNLVCRIHLDPAARSLMVPPMMVQPLIEDAFHYRLQSNDLPLQIWLTAGVEAGLLRVTLSNTGEKASSEGDQDAEFGIRALRQRLRLLLGPQASVERHEADGWIRVTIQIPVQASA